jgi:hypothetical protein
MAMETQSSVSDTLTIDRPQFVQGESLVALGSSQILPISTGTGSWFDN